MSPGKRTAELPPQRIESKLNRAFTLQLDRIPQEQVREATQECEMKNFIKGFLLLATSEIGLSARTNAQTVVLNGGGSSAMFLQLGQAAYHGLGCIVFGRAIS